MFYKDVYLSKKESEILERRVGITFTGVQRLFISNLDFFSNCFSYFTTFLTSYMHYLHNEAIIKMEKEGGVRDRKQEVGTGKTAFHLHLSSREATSVP